MFTRAFHIWVKAIKKNHFTTWPGLTEQLVSKHLPKSVATAEGHLNQEQQGLQSTKMQKNKIIKPNHEEVISNFFQPSKNPVKTAIQQKFESITDDDDYFPKSDSPNIKTNEVLYCLASADKAGLAFSDLTGRFPIQSSRGNNYVLIAYHVDANAILQAPLKNRQALSIVNAWESINKKFKAAGVQPSTCIMDNECSNDLKQALTKQNVSWQLVPLHNNRANRAERAIQTFKTHFKACLVTINDEFLMREWDRLLYQVEFTLTLLRSAKANSNLSAYAYLFGEFDYNKTPIVPPGTRVVAHTKPQQQASWELNGEQGWYIGPAQNRYRCIQVYFEKTRSMRIIDTVTFFPKKIKFPQVQLEDFLKQAAMDIITLLTQPPESTTITVQARDATKNALLQLATILNKAELLPDPVSPNPLFFPDAPPPRVPPDKSSPRVSPKTPSPTALIIPELQPLRVPPDILTPTVVSATPPTMAATSKFTNIPLTKQKSQIFQEETNIPPPLPTN